MPPRPHSNLPLKDSRSSTYHSENKREISDTSSSIAPLSGGSFLSSSPSLSLQTPISENSDTSRSLSFASFSNDSFDSKHLISTPLPISIQEKSGQSDLSVSVLSPSSPLSGEDEYKVKSPMDPASPSSTHEKDEDEEPVEREFKKNLMGIGYVLPSTEPLEIQPFMRHQQSRGSLSINSSSDISTENLSATPLDSPVKEKISLSDCQIFELSPSSREKSNIPHSRSRVLLETYNSQIKKTQEASLQLQFAQTQYGTVDDKSYPTCKTFQMPTVAAYLIERTTLLSKIAHQLHSQPSFMVAHGISGAGKTQLVSRYAQLAATADQSCGEHKLNYQVVLWVRAECD